MGKVKSFAAKTAHGRTSEGHIMCPVCNVEIKRVKVIGNKKVNAGWSPRYSYIKVCKCNETDFAAGKIQ